MKIKCEYCGSIRNSEIDQCPSCGARLQKIVNVVIESHPTSNYNKPLLSSPISPTSLWNDLKTFIITIAVSMVCLGWICNSFSKAQSDISKSTTKIDNGDYYQALKISRMNKEKQAVIEKQKAHDKELKFLLDQKRLDEKSSNSIVDEKEKQRIAQRNHDQARWNAYQEILQNRSQRIYRGLGY